MKQLWKKLTLLRRKAALTPEQADQLAQIKFPCC
jgi:hypothetical protein